MTFNHKLEMHKLEKMKIKKLNASREIQKEISKIDTAIKEHKRLYLLSNKYADESNKILNGYSKDNIKNILYFLLAAMVAGNAEYQRAYKGVDTDLLLEDENFFDFLIVQVGAATIKEMKSNFAQVVNKDGNAKLEIISARGKNKDSFNNRLFRKMTKAPVIKEAHRIMKEKQAKNKELSGIK